MKKNIVLTISIILMSGCQSENHDNNINSLVIKENYINIKAINKGYELNYEISPSDGDENDIVWLSNDENIATVNGGVIYGQHEGKTTITATSRGKVLDTIEVNVSSYKLYTIGNSHTWDLEPKSSLVSLAKDMGVELQNDWHVNCNSSIEDSVRDPKRTCVNSTHGNYLNAINSETYDAITIQPFFGSTGASEVEAIKTLISQIKSSASSSAKIYIYYTWPRNDQDSLNELDYHSIWLKPYYPNDQFENLNRDFISYLKQELKESNIDISGYIPAAETLNDFDSFAKEGIFDSYQGAGYLYRDHLHMNNVGKYIAGQTMVATLFDHLKLSSEVPDGYHVTGARGDQKLNTQLTEKIRDIVENRVKQENSDF
ncbi:Ig-like domain-containing protein [Vibrio rotiferianus]|uniref:Ig-like domain-containing protein n=1 Tax=Vibrio rotiferianus TaxID=190895 RepID=UPI00248FAED2|nr:Ig-like domain-containing protein [Vibrio rotiferianus]